MNIIKYHCSTILNIQGHNFKNDEMNRDTLIITRNDKSTRTVVDNLMSEFTFVFDYRYNGRFPTVRVPYPTVSLEYRVCTENQHIYDFIRGFSVVIFDTGISLFYLFLGSVNKKK